MCREVCLCKLKMKWELVTDLSLDFISRINLQLRGWEKTHIVLKPEL